MFGVCARALVWGCVWVCVCEREIVCVACVACVVRACARVLVCGVWEEQAHVNAGLDETFDLGTGRSR